MDAIFESESLSVTYSVAIFIVFIASYEEK